ncbi:MAG TPA: hypothetical protein VNV14_07325 [Opitutaceae bacterium]|jgi:hypothetical protein|nr:hypothetical protein [Opitutaceae bacterium]
MNEKNFQMVVKFGPIVLGLCLLLNIWGVMRYREVYRDAIKAEVQLQQVEAGGQIVQAVLQEFSAHANSDPHIAEIFRQAQAQAAVQRNQPFMTPPQ